LSLISAFERRCVGCGELVGRLSLRLRAASARRGDGVCTAMWLDGQFSWLAARDGRSSSASMRGVSRDV